MTYVRITSENSGGINFRNGFMCVTSKYSRAIDLVIQVFRMVSRDLRFNLMRYFYSTMVTIPREHPNKTRYPSLAEPFRCDLALFFAGQKGVSPLRCPENHSATGALLQPFAMWGSNLAWATKLFT